MDISHHSCSKYVRIIELLKVTSTSISPGNFFKLLFVMKTIDVIFVMFLILHIVISSFVVFVNL